MATKKLRSVPKSEFVECHFSRVLMPHQGSASDKKASLAKVRATEAATSVQTRLQEGVSDMSFSGQTLARAAGPICCHNAAKVLRPNLLCVVLTSFAGSVLSALSLKEFAGGLRTKERGDLLG